MIERILPIFVISADTGTDAPGIRLFPEEEQLVARSSARRRREFGTVRACARAALVGLGHPPRAVLPGARGAPQWPAGVVGSMTHCRGYRAAAVSRTEEALAIGIDAEPDLPLPEGVLEFVAGAAECRQVGALLRARPGVRWDRLLFSAKEAVYKAWFPLVGGSLGLDGIEIVLSPERRSWCARVAGTGPLTHVEGRWLAAEGLLVSAVVVTGRPGQAGCV